MWFFHFFNFPIIISTFLLLLLCHKRAYLRGEICDCSALPRYYQTVMQQLLAKRWRGRWFACAAFWVFSSHGAPFSAHHTTPQSQQTTCNKGLAFEMCAFIAYYLLLIAIIAGISLVAVALVVVVATYYCAVRRCAQQQLKGRKSMAVVCASKDTSAAWAWQLAVVAFKIWVLENYFQFHLFFFKKKKQKKNYFLCIIIFLRYFSAPQMGTFVC